MLRRSYVSQSQSRAQGWGGAPATAQVALTSCELEFQAAAQTGWRVLGSPSSGQKGTGNFALLKNSYFKSRSSLAYFKIVFFPFSHGLYCEVLVKLLKI